MAKTQLGRPENAPRSNKDKNAKPASSYLTLLGGNVRNVSRAQANRTSPVSRGTSSAGYSRPIDKDVVFVTEDYFKITTEDGFTITSDGNTFSYYSYE